MLSPSPRHWQFLCELDGVDELRGVYVVAASNRPECTLPCLLCLAFGCMRPASALGAPRPASARPHSPRRAGIDPALLRPGRLDRRALCPVPPREAREAILRSLARGLPLATSALDALRATADAADGYTGADLHALLANAQLAAVRDTAPAAAVLAAAAATTIATAPAAAAPATMRPSEDDIEGEGEGALIEACHVEAALLTTRRSFSEQARRERERADREFGGGGGPRGLTPLKDVGKRSTHR